MSRGKFVLRRNVEKTLQRNANTSVYDICNAVTYTNFGFRPSKPSSFSPRSGSLRHRVNAISRDVSCAAPCLFCRIRKSVFASSPSIGASGMGWTVGRLEDMVVGQWACGLGSPCDIGWVCLVKRVACLNAYNTQHSILMCFSFSVLNVFAAANFLGRGCPAKPSAIPSVWRRKHT